MKYNKVGRRQYNPRCTSSGKVSYPDKKTAVTARNFLGSGHFNRLRSTKELRVYQCPSCGSWHLSKVKVEHEL